MFALKLATSLVLGIALGYSGLSYITENTNGLSLGDVRVFVTTQGGTGTSSPSGILYGDGTSALKTVAIGSNLTFSGGTLSSTGGGGGSGTIEWEIFSNVYSQSALRPTTTQNIHVSGVGTSTMKGGLDVWRQIATPFVHATSTTETSTFATPPTFSTLTSALLLTGSGGLTAEYAGTSCTNQFARSLSSLGVATCATVMSGDVDLADLTSGNTSLTFSGTYDGQTARTIILNVGNANVWTALQTFTNSSSTQLTVGNAGTNVGIYFTQDGDGALTVQGIGNNANESLTYNFDDVADTVDVSSATGVSNFDFNALTVTAGAVLANANDGGALGASGTAWSDLFLASGGIINWAAGDVTLTHGSGLLTLSASDGFTMTGAFINSDGSLEIPNGTAPTVDAEGEIALDQNGAIQQLLVGTSTNASFPMVEPLGFRIPIHYSSTTWTGTTTIYYGGGAFHPFTLRSVYCRSNTGTALIRIGDGTNWTNVASVSSTNASSSLTTNTAFTYGEDVDIQIGTPASGASVVGCTFEGFYDRI